MTRIELASLAILLVALIGAAMLLLVAPALPIPAALILLLSTSLALLWRQQPAGYSVGQTGLFLVFLIGIVHAIGDYDLPEYVEPVLSPYAQVAIVCLLYLGCAIVLRRGQAKMRVRLRGVSL